MNLNNYPLIMKSTAFDGDNVLTGYLTDYLDGKLVRGERDAFEHYLDSNPREKEFARKAMLGKQALSRLANKFKRASEDFEARLALRVALDRTKLSHEKEPCR